MRLAGAELIDSREILPGQWLQEYRSPELVSGARAGQFVHVRTGDYSGLVLRRPFSFNTIDVVAGTLTIHFRTIGRGTEWFTRLRPGDRVDMLGPAGPAVRGRSADAARPARSRAGSGIAGVRSLADEAIRDGRQVTLLFGGATARDVYPSSLLPDEVEYVVATDDGSVGHHGYVTDLVKDYEAWADQAFACGPAADAPLARGARRDPAATAGRRLARSEARRRAAGRRRARRRRAARRSSRSRWSRTWAAPSGACLGCVVMDTKGTPQRVCREGPGVRLRRARVGGGLAVKAKRRVVTSRGAPHEAPPDGPQAQAGDRAGRRRADRSSRRRRQLDASVGSPSVPPARRGSSRRAMFDRRRRRCRHGRRRRPVGRPRARAASWRTRSSSPRGRSATARSTPTSSRSSGSARSAARARPSGRGSATRRRG